MILSFQEKCPVYSIGPTAASPANNSSSNNNANRSSSTPPYPTAATTNPVHHYPSANANPPYPGNNPPYPTVDPPPHLMPQPNVMSSAGLIITIYNTLIHYRIGYPPPAHYQTPYPSDPAPPALPPPVPPPPMQQIGSGYGYSTSTIQPTHIRASLLSAVEDRIKQKLRDKLGNKINNSN